MPDRQAEIGNNRMAQSAPVFHLVGGWFAMVFKL